MQKSAKGNAVVPCDRSAYTKRMKELIEDDTKFTDLNKLPDEWLTYILSSEKRVRQALYKYCETNKKHAKYVFTDQQYMSIAPTGTRPSILYGLPEIHKALVKNLPKFRPIISMIATPMPINCPSFWFLSSKQLQPTNIRSRIHSPLQKKQSILIHAYSCHHWMLHHFSQIYH